MDAFSWIILLALGACVLLHVFGHGHGHGHDRAGHARGHEGERESAEAARTAPPME